MRNTIFLILTAIVIISCSQKKVETVSDTQSLSDNSEQIEKVEKKAVNEDKEIEQVETTFEKDNSFYSFFDKFAWIAKFQKKRIQFPLKVESENDTSELEKHEWRIKDFYGFKSFYPFLMQSDKNPFRDESVEFNKANLSYFKVGDEEVVSYCFENLDSTWFLVKIKNGKLEKMSSLGSFFQFIEKFSTDSLYQIDRIIFPFRDSYLDSDKEYELVTKIKKQEDWEFLNLQEHLSEVMIMQYDSDSLNSNKIVLYFRGIECGISVEYIFEFRENKWFLIEINDYST